MSWFQESCIFLINLLPAAEAPPPPSDRSEDGDSGDSLTDSSSANDISRLLPAQPASVLRKQKGNWTPGIVSLPVPESDMSQSDVISDVISLSLRCGQRLNVSSSHLYSSIFLRHLPSSPSSYFSVVHLQQTQLQPSLSSSSTQYQSEASLLH